MRFPAKVPRAIVGLGVLLFPNFVFAEINDNAEYTGTLRFVPKLESHISYSDNVLLDSTNSLRSPISLLNPQFLLSTDNFINRSTLAYSGQYAFYHASAADNYLDHLAKAQIHHEFLRYVAMDVSGSYYMTHENRGTDFSGGAATLLSEPDRFNIINANALLTLGTKVSTGRIEVELDQYQKAFTSRTDVTEERNYNKSRVRLAYYHHLSAKTAFLAEGNYSLISYVVTPTSVASRDSAEQRYLVGATWDVTAITQGHAKFGVNIKQFDDTSRSRTLGVGWELGVNWSPTELLKINVISSGRTEESIGFSDYANRKSVSTGGTYAITRALSFTLTSGLSINEYPPTTAKDVSVATNMKLDYKANRWLSFGIGYEYAQQLSNREGLDFKRNIYLASILLTL